MSARPPIVEEVVSRHAEDAAFLWRRRDRAVRAPRHTLADLARLDDRVEAHLDGLAIAGEAGWRLVREQLAGGDAGDVFAAAAAALGRADGALAEVVEAARAGGPGAWRGLVSALAWGGDAAAAGPWLDRLSGSGEGDARAAATAARACLRAFGRGALERSLADPAPAVRARALRAVGEMGRVDLGESLGRALSGGEAECRYWAAWASTLLGRRHAVPVLLAEAGPAGGSLAEGAVDLVARASGVEAGAGLCRRLASEGRVRLALVAARALGDPTQVPWLLEAMAGADHARLAGEAFSTLAGVDLVEEGLEGGAPPGHASGPTDDPDDDDVSMDDDGDLPWPDPAKTRRWWERHRGDFADGRRYVLGEPLSAPALQSALRSGSQRQRAGAALDLALLGPGSPLVEVRASGRLQLARTSG